MCIGKWKNEKQQQQQHHHLQQYGYNQWTKDGKIDEGQVLSLAFAKESILLFEALSFVLHLRDRA